MARRCQFSARPRQKSHPPAHRPASRSLQSARWRARGQNSRPGRHELEATRANVLAAGSPLKPSQQFTCSLLALYWCICVCVLARARARVCVTAQRICAPLHPGREQNTQLDKLEIFQDYPSGNCLDRRDLEINCLSVSYGQARASHQPRQAEVGRS